MATAAQYAAAPINALAQVSTANALRDGTGTLVTVAAGQAAGTLGAYTALGGSRIDDITIKAVGTTTAGMIRLFLTLDGGTTNRLITEIPVDARAPSATVESWSRVLTDQALVLQNTSALLRASTHNGEIFNIAVTRAGAF